VEGNYYFKIKDPAVINYKIRNKEITVEHNFIKYSLSYMFRLLFNIFPIGANHVTK
jgi:hypothetical protein